MAEISFRRPHLTDIAWVAANLRAADLAELAAVGDDHDPHQVVRQGVDDSVYAHAIVVEGRPVAICGLAAYEGPVGEIGVPWMLGTAELPRHARALMRYAGPYILEMLRAYPVLLNFVHAENTRAVAWLRHMKFEVRPAAPYGPLGMPFHRFEMRR